jgi:hypothetical protein
MCAGIARPKSLGAETIANHRGFAISPQCNRATRSTKDGVMADYAGRQSSANRGHEGAVEAGVTPPGKSTRIEQAYGDTGEAPASALAVQRKAAPDAAASDGTPGATITARGTPPGASAGLRAFELGERAPTVAMRASNRGRSIAAGGRVDAGAMTATE